MLFEGTLTDVNGNTALVSVDVTDNSPVDPNEGKVLVLTGEAVEDSAVMSWSWDGTNPDYWVIAVNGQPRATVRGTDRGISIDALPRNAEYAIEIWDAGLAVDIYGLAHVTIPALPEPEPVNVIPNVGQAVTIGSSSRVVNGVDTYRNTNHLTVYTRTDLQLKTPTNLYGAEVTVVEGKVTAIADRLTTQGGQVDIPANGYVLSGHGTSRDWLLAQSGIGVPVTVGTAPEPPEPQPSGDALPAEIVGAYVNMYQGPAIIELPDYNVIFAAFALGKGSQQMWFVEPAKETVASFKAGIAADQARGAKWILSIGGGVPSTEATVIQTAAHADTVFSKLVPIIDAYGFNGLDYDLENGPAGFTSAGLLALSRKLKAKYGPSFAITMTPRPYENFYFDCAAAHHAEGILDALQFQFYDAAETRDDAYLASWIPSRLDAAKAAGVPYSKMVVGCITAPGYPYGWNDAATYGTIIQNMKTTRGIKGAMVWDTALDKGSGWSFYNMAKNL